MPGDDDLNDLTEDQLAALDKYETSAEGQKQGREEAQAAKLTKLFYKTPPTAFKGGNVRACPSAFHRLPPLGVSAPRPRFNPGPRFAGACFRAIARSSSTDHWS